MTIKPLIKNMRNWASQQRSLASYQEKLGNMDARTALIGSALTVEEFADSLEKIEKK